MDRLWHVRERVTAPPVGGHTACEAELLFVIVDGVPGSCAWRRGTSNSLTARMPRVSAWIEANFSPTFSACRRPNRPSDKFPEKTFAELGYESRPPW